MNRSTLLRHTATGLLVLATASTAVVGVGAMRGENPAAAPAHATPAAATSGEMNPWAAADAAVAQYFAELGRRCPSGAVDQSAPTTVDLVARGRECFTEGTR